MINLKTSNYKIIGTFKEEELVHYNTYEKEKQLGKIISIDETNFEIKTFRIENYITKEEEKKIYVSRDDYFSTEGRFEKIRLTDYLIPNAKIYSYDPLKKDNREPYTSLSMDEFKFKNFYLYKIDYKMKKKEYNFLVQIQSSTSRYLFSQFQITNNLEYEHKEHDISYKVNSKNLQPISSLTKLIEQLNENKIEYSIDEFIKNLIQN